jgi:hypothetical protein
MALIDPARDIHGCKLFLPLFIKTAVGQTSEILKRREALRAQQNGPDQYARRIGQLADKEIPWAYEMWFVHLCEISEMIAIAPLERGDVTAEEIMGIRLLRAAREEFWESHKRCKKCGSVNSRSAILSCPGCGAKEG